jgi:predicted DsbA family dithiol-disulfide isomerase
LLVLVLDTVGRAEGIQFDWGGQTANTLQSHRLVAYASQHGKQDAIVNALFHAYFEERKNLGDLAVLVDAAQQAGVPEVRREVPPAQAHTPC